MTNLKRWKCILITLKTKGLILKNIFRHFENMTEIQTLSLIKKFVLNMKIICTKTMLLILTICSTKLSFCLTILKRFCLNMRTDSTTFWLMNFKIQTLFNTNSSRCLRVFIKTCLSLVMKTNVFIHGEGQISTIFSI